MGDGGWSLTTFRPIGASARSAIGGTRIGGSPHLNTNDVVADDGAHRRYLHSFCPCSSAQANPAAHRSMFLHCSVGLEAIWGEAGINPVFIGCGRRSGEAPGARSQPSHHLVPFGLQTA
jgi:hypothetical protein